MVRGRGRVVFGAVLSATILLLAPDRKAAATEELWPDLSKVARSGGGEKDAAVIVGIEKYAFVPAVPGAVHNANDWYDYFTKGRSIPAESVRLIRNEEATVERMKRAVAEAAKRVRAGGKLWFVFIGHGAANPDSKGGTLIGYDAQQNTEGLYARSFSQADLAAATKTRHSPSVIVLDACFSGRAGNGESLVKGVQPVVIQKIIRVSSEMTVLGAGSEFAGQLLGTERPAFSYLVLGALRGWGDRDEDGRVAAIEAIDYARTAIRTTITDRVQTPELNGRGDVILTTGAREAGPNLIEIVKRVRDAKVTPTPPHNAGCADTACANTLLSGRWECSIGSGTTISIARGRIEMSTPQGPQAAGCMTCDGSFELVTSDGRFASTNGHFVAGAAAASVDWESCESDLATCRSNPQRHFVGPFSCRRALATPPVVEQPPPQPIQQTPTYVNVPPPPAATWVRTPAPPPPQQPVWIPQQAAPQQRVRSWGAPSQPVYRPATVPARTTAPGWAPTRTVAPTQAPQQRTVAPPGTPRQRGWRQ